MASSSTTATVFNQISNRRFVLSIDDNSLLSVADNNNTVLNAVRIDNTANTHAVYLKLYNSDSGAAGTLGTTNPEWIFPCAASSTADFSLDAGYTFTVGIQAACVQNAGTAGTTSVSNAVTCVILATIP